MSLSNHKRRHKIPAVKNLRKHKCEKCPYESEVKSNVNRHKKQVHEQKPDKVKKSWNCDKCETKHTSKYGYDRHVKTNEKRSSQSENQVKKVKSASEFGTFVREKKWGWLTNICVVNALKHSILPSTWRGTWWANCTRKSPKRKRAEQLSCEEWESFYQNQITSKKSTGNGKVVTLLA